MAMRENADCERDLSPDIQRLRHNVRLDRIHYLPLDQLVSYARKLRKRSDAARRALVGSVSGFGIVLPILIDQNSVVVAGEGILEAARELGYTEVPTLRVDHLDENEVRLLRIALNKLGDRDRLLRKDGSSEEQGTVVLSTVQAMADAYAIGRANGLKPNVPT